MSSTDNGCVDFGISHQLDLSELAASDDPEDCGSASREKSGRISTFFSRVLSRFRRGNEMVIVIIKLFNLIQ